MAAVMDSMHPSFDEEEQLLEQRLDVDLDEEPGNFPTHDLVLSPGVSPECLEQWKNKSLDDRCREVMEHLEDGRRRWSEDDEPSNVPILEDFKKSLLLKPDLREDNTPTTLHVLARRWRSYKLGIPAVRKAVMFLIENAEDTIEPGFSGHPVWKAAMNIGGIEFLDFLKDNFRSKLPDIMAVQDKDGRNFIHAIFYIVQDKSYPHLSLDARRTFTFDYPSRPIPENNVGTRFVPEATAQILAMQDNDGNTPIHYAMYRIQALGRSDRYIDMVKSMVETAEPCLARGNDFNRLDQSPIQYCLWTLKQRRNRPNNSSRSDSKDGRNTVRPVPGIKEAPKPNQPPRSEPRPGNPTQERDSSLGVPPTNAPKKNNLVPESPDAPAGYGFSRSSTNPSLQPPKPDGPVVPQIKEPQGKGLVPVAPERKPSRSASMAAPRPSGGGQTAPQEKAREAPKPSTTGTQKPSAGDQQKDPMASVEKLMQVLKRHYVRERREIFARELVYGRNTNGKLPNYVFLSWTITSADLEKWTSSLASVDDPWIHLG